VAVEEPDATLHVRLAGELDLAAVPLVEKALDPSRSWWYDRAAQPAASSR
jgi:hypothetical protein